MEEDSEEDFEKDLEEDDLEGCKTWRGIWRRAIWRGVI